MDKKAEGEGEKTESIKLADSGWVIKITRNDDIDGSYTIEKIFAIFGYKMYFPIDTSEFTDEEWDIFHERLERELRK